MKESDILDLKYRDNMLITIIATIYALFFLYTGFFGLFEAPIQRSIHLIFAIVLGFLYYKPSKKANMKVFLVLDCVLAIIAIFSFGFFVINKDLMNSWMMFISKYTDTMFLVCLVCLFLLLEVGRRSTGISLPIVAIIAILYAYGGGHLSGVFHHRGFSFRRIMEFTFCGFGGVFGLPISMCSTLIIIFIIFGCVYEEAGGGQYLMDLGKFLAGRSRGGPAKIAVITSSLFGAISGSAVANVYATGSFSIPMMKKLGYRPEFAGAVEATASTGGQLAPPVMGAAAFVMAEYIGVPYVEIMIAALVPALLYYLSLFLQVDFESALHNMKGLGKEEIPSWPSIWKRGYFLFPLVLLVILLLKGFSAPLAGSYAVLSVIIVSFFSKENRLTPKKLINSFSLAGKRTVMIASSCAISGIIIGVVAYTGLGLNFVGSVAALGRGSIWIAPVLVALACIVLGMGVPTTVAYIVVAAVAVPALKELGFETVACHMFAFYFALVSMITPPVAPASLAAAEISNTKFMKTGFEAAKLGIITFIIPFMFLFAPELLMIGSSQEIILAVTTSVIGVVAFAAGLKGWFLIKLPIFTRILLIISGICMIWPGLISDLAGIGVIGLELIWIITKKVHGKPGKNTPSDTVAG